MERGDSLAGSRGAGYGAVPLSQAKTIRPPRSERRRVRPLSAGLTQNHDDAAFTDLDATCQGSQLSVRHMTFASEEDSVLPHADKKGVALRCQHNFRGTSAREQLLVSNIPPPALPSATQERIRMLGRRGMFGDAFGERPKSTPSSGKNKTSLNVENASLIPVVVDPWKTTPLLRLAATSIGEDWGERKNANAAPNYLFFKNYDKVITV